MVRLAYVDYIKTVALLFVIAVHSLGFVDFYEPTSWGGVIIVYMLRVAFMTCVPLFLIATGMVQGGKRVDRKHYSGIIKIIITYISCGILCTIFKILHSIYKNQDIDVVNDIVCFFNFTAAPFGWYVAMFLGLYLLIPFLNILYDHLSYAKKIVLIFSLMLLVVLPRTLNSYNLTNIESLPHVWYYATSNKHTKLVDEYWMNLYPVLYFYIGRFFQEFRSGLTRSFRFDKLLVILFLSMALFGTYNYLKNYNFPFGWGLDSSYGGIQALVTSIVITICIMKVGHRDVKVVRFISTYTLGAYLLSYIVDSIIYRSVSSQIEIIRYVSLLFLVPVNLMLSTCLSYLVSKMSSPLQHWLSNQFVCRYVFFSRKMF